MTSIITRVENPFNHEWIRPGQVGSVGDVLGQVRVRQSEPNMPFKYDKIFSGADEPFRGANIQDGYIGSWTSQGMAAKVLDSNWEANRSFKTAVGWVHQDISAPDKMVTPVYQAQPSYSWVNRQAEVKKALVSGQNFLPLPGGYQPGPGDIPRGGQVPRVTDEAVPEYSPPTDRVGGSFLDSPPAAESFLGGGPAVQRPSPQERASQVQGLRGFQHYLQGSGRGFNGNKR